MSRRLAATLCTVTAAAGALTMGTPAAEAATGQFAGAWTSTDTDGSSQVMRIAGSDGGAYGVRLYDDAASVCGGAPATFAGSGKADGDVLVVIGSVSCHPGGNVFRHRIEFVLFLEGDTLVDGSDVVWSATG